MYKGKKIAVVIPAYNEEKFIANVIKDIPSFVDLIVVIDDASHDRTYERVQEADDCRVILLSNMVNQRVGGSTIKGYQKALELGSEVVVKVDGDRQMPLDRLPSLLDAIIEGGYDYAKGNCFLDQGLTQMTRGGRSGSII
jgi:glycosyltransferase involved in cell wall biosynthesis